MGWPESSSQSLSAPFSCLTSPSQLPVISLKYLSVGEEMNADECSAKWQELWVLVCG